MCINWAFRQSMMLPTWSVSKKKETHERLWTKWKLRIVTTTSTFLAYEVILWTYSWPLQWMDPCRMNIWQYTLILLRLLFFHNTIRTVLTETTPSSAWTSDLPSDAFLLLWVPGDGSAWRRRVYKLCVFVREQWSWWKIARWRLRISQIRQSMKSTFSRPLGGGRLLLCLRQVNDLSGWLIPESGRLWQPWHTHTHRHPLFRHHCCFVLQSGRTESFFLVLHFHFPPLTLASHAPPA